MLKLNKNLLDKEFLDSKIDKLRDKAKIVFSFSNFNENWLNAIK